MGVRNRIVMPSMATFLPHEGRNGVDLHKAYYEARARGGVGLIITELISVDYERGAVYREQLRVDDDKHIPGLSEIAEAIKKHGARAALQLHHGGATAKTAVTGQQPISASAINWMEGQQGPREATLSEIADIVARYAKGAERARKAGFDGVEIQGGHHYLIGQFMSPTWNKRKDDYGGSLQNRARLLLEAIKAVREAVGEDYPVWCRINGKEWTEGGNTVEDAQEVAVWAQEAGADAINVSGHPPMTQPYQPYNQPVGTLVEQVLERGPGYFIFLGEAMKKVVGIPVVVAGRISPKLGESVLRQRKADFIAMGRALIADPELPNKLMSGQINDVTPCVYCNCCQDPFCRDCTVNAAKGRESEFEVKPAEGKKKVMVVGGGPAGMEAARVAALRGHEVILYEKEHRLGGQLILAGIIREEYEGLNRYLATQIGKCGVRVNTGKEVTPALVESIKPDVVILAAGLMTKAPEIPRIDSINVISSRGIGAALGRRGSWLTGTRWRRALWSMGFGFLQMPLGALAVKWLLGFTVPLGRKIVVLGGGLAGLEIADYLVEKGKEVTILETGDSVKGGERPMYLFMEYYFYKLTLKGVSMLTNVKYEQITDKGLVIEEKDGKSRFIGGVDTIVLTAGARGNDVLAEELKGEVPEIHLVGDSAEPCGIREAIAAGSRVGRTV